MYSLYAVAVFVVLTDMTSNRQIDDLAAIAQAFV